MAKNTNHKKEVVEAYNKELDRDIINMNLPEIDWSEPPTGYPENFDELVDKYRKEGK